MAFSQNLLGCGSPLRIPASSGVWFFPTDTNIFWGCGVWKVEYGMWGVSYGVWDVARRV